jgi:hypothetical protein
MVANAGRTTIVARPLQVVDKAPPVVDYAAVTAAYAYELRRGAEIFSTGRLIAEHDLSQGDDVAVAGVVAKVVEISWSNGERRLILQAAVPARRG